MRFNPTLAALAFATTAALASFSAQAASIDVKVIGTITPGACTPNLAGGGVIDYGNIGAATLSQGGLNVLPEKMLTFTINCDLPTRVAVRATDNRASSLVPGATTAIGSGFTNAYNFGLGTVSGANVGGYVMRMKQSSFTADGASVSTTSSNDGGASWLNTISGAIGHSATMLSSWSATSGGVPVAFSTLSGNLSVEAVLNKGSALPLTNDVPLDGLATLELVYL